MLLVTRKCENFQRKPVEKDGWSNLAVIGAVSGQGTATGDFVVGHFIPGAKNKEPGDGRNAQSSDCIRSVHFKKYFNSSIYRCFCCTTFYLTIVIGKITQTLKLAFPFWPGWQVVLDKFLK